MKLNISKYISILGLLTSTTLFCCTSSPNLGENYMFGGFQKGFLGGKSKVGEASTKAFTSGEKQENYDGYRDYNNEITKNIFHVVSSPSFKNQIGECYESLNFSGRDPYKNPKEAWINMPKDSPPRKSP